jgi:hypothetical protein
MLSGQDIPPSDLRRSLFCSLVVNLGSNELDAFKALAASMYTLGKTSIATEHLKKKGLMTKGLTKVAGLKSLSRKWHWSSG